jgi:poly [ADP-ribose] polymerase 10/14/15
MRLFHGTKHDLVDKILTKGFDRNLTTRQNYGKGVYFASESHTSTYFSRRNVEGKMHMFLVRVAVGDTCKGAPGDMVPPRARPNPTSSNDLCDSTVDNTADPSIFATYHDAQQYPEYLIRFKDL